ncbi:MAG: hotdog fold thioesterase [Aurantimicrobium sp.]|uniref:PaaI family thioesterase n=1 Tax=Aurantimicrobium minutum TaxID=708131 RepID=UPI0024058618|nr:hotdog fold thioesterase [Aurantimicrobium minutum]
MGIQLHELSPEYAVATMPVKGNTQSVGILHGGAYVVIAEGLGSIAANMFAGEGRVAVGIEVSATHTGSISEGFVTATCKALHLGRTLTTHEIVCTDENGRRLSTIRLTNFIKDRKK